MSYYRGSGAPLDPVEFDCLACSNKRADRKSIGFGFMKFPIRREFEPVLFMHRPDFETKSILASSLNFFGKTNFTVSQYGTP